eukprot:2078719-Prymnesium_polylepis.1
MVHVTAQVHHHPRAVVGPHAPQVGKEPVLGRRVERGELGHGKSHAPDGVRVPRREADRRSEAEAGVHLAFDDELVRWLMSVKLVAV